MRTAEKWLAMPEDEQALEVAKLVTPEPEGEDKLKRPWRHTFRNYEDKCCLKCSMQAEFSGPCPIPDPVDLESAIAAFEVRDRIVAQVGEVKYADTLILVVGNGVEADIDQTLATVTIQHYWITNAILAAAMAAERSNE